jgi:hypothetical protein
VFCSTPWAQRYQNENVARIWGRPAKGSRASEGRYDGRTARSPAPRTAQPACGRTRTSHPCQYSLQTLVRRFARELAERLRDERAYVVPEARPVG